MTKLYLSYARTRQAGTRTIECTPSRFLARLPRTLIERVSASAPATITPAPQRDSSSEMAEDDNALTAETLTATAPDEETQDAVEMPAVNMAEPEIETESDFDRWLGEAQSAWNECEVEHADEIEAWVLSEVGGDDTALEAQIMVGEEIEIPADVEARMAEAQSELLEHETRAPHCACCSAGVSLAKAAYEQEASVHSPVSAAPAQEAKRREEDESPDFDALLKEYADEIAAHEYEEPHSAPIPQRKPSYALTE